LEDAIEARDPNEFSDALVEQFIQGPPDLGFDLVRSRAQQLLPNFAGTPIEPWIAETLAGSEPSTPEPEGSPLPGASLLLKCCVMLIDARRLTSRPAKRSRRLAQAVSHTIGCEMMLAYGATHPDEWRAYCEAPLEEMRAEEYVQWKVWKNPMRGWYDDPDVVSAERRALEAVVAFLAARLGEPAP